MVGKLKGRKRREPAGGGAEGTIENSGEGE